MKTKYLLALAVFTYSFISIGCNKKPEIEQIEEIRPVKSLVVSSVDAGGIRNFPGRVDASQRADLSFRVSGKIQELLVKEGDMIEKDEVIAKLDPTDFQITVNNKSATFNRAKNDFSRAKNLIKDGNISKIDYDKLESNFLSARADLNLAKQQLAYTELTAPFDGVIARRYIQSFEEVQAKQNIVSINNVELLEVKFDVPENLILTLRKIESKGSTERFKAKDHIQVMASFQSRQDKEYALTFKEVATKAEENTQTFTVTYTMPRPDDVMILPGMSASVKVDLSKVVATKDMFYLPVSAVVADINLQGTVWIVNQETMQVEPVSVTVGKLKGNEIEISEGLKEGQRVVVAGVPFLYKGLKVSLMKEDEQARDNLKHERPIMKPNSNNANNEG